MRGASASGPAAQTRRPGADARRAARTPGAAASSTTPGREDEGNSTARQQNLSRPPHPEVAQAARTGEWQPCMRWALDNLLGAVQQGAKVADSVGLSMWEGGPRTKFMYRFRDRKSWSPRGPGVLQIISKAPQG